jgi:Transposase protein
MGLASVVWEKGLVIDLSQMLPAGAGWSGLHAGRSRINDRRFIRRRAKLDGRWVDYLLHDDPVRFLNGRLRLRQVTRLYDDGHQTTVITSRWDLREIEVAYRMFERWRQENFFKYMRDWTFGGRDLHGAIPI